MTISSSKTGRERASRAAGRYCRPAAGAAREQSQPTASPRAAEGAAGAEGLADFSGQVSDSGEGLWTVLADQSLFTSSAGIERLWEISAPLLQNPPPVQPYARGSWGPQSVDRLIAPHHWHLPDR